MHSKADYDTEYRSAENVCGVVHSRHNAGDTQNRTREKEPYARALIVHIDNGGESEKERGVSGRKGVTVFRDKRDKGGVRDKRPRAVNKDANELDKSPRDKCRKQAFEQKSRAVLYKRLSKSEYDKDESNQIGKICCEKDNERIKSHTPLLYHSFEDIEILPVRPAVIKPGDFKEEREVLELRMI